MRPFSIVVALVVANLAGCVSAPPTYTMTKPFDEALARRDTMPGPNTIKGSALIRQNGGGVVTCAGNDVFAIPASPYADEKMWQIYGSYQRGFRPVNLGSIQFKNEAPLFKEVVLRTKCDAQGNFVFAKVSDATFYIVTRIVWSVGGSEQGGFLMAKTHVWKGETKEVVLAP